MEYNFSHFPMATLSSEEAHDIIANAVSVFRGSPGQPSEEPRYPLPQLFQALAVMERVLYASELAKREKPSRELSDAEILTPMFIKTLEFRTQEYIEALRVCLPIMESSRGVPMPGGLLAASLLNNFGANPKEATIADIRHRVCSVAIEYNLLYSDIVWTQEMHDNLMGWYSPALLLCDPRNIPPMLGIVERLALDVVTGMEPNPRRRFQSKELCEQFTTMVTLNPAKVAQDEIALPPTFQM